MTRSALAIALALTLAFAASPASAGGAANKATAEALFKEGRQLMTSGKSALACPKLAESQRLDPAAGTLLNLAECYEKNGQTASAWATFADAARAADLRRRADWKATAESRIKELEPLLSYLVIEVDAETSALSELVVTRDGEAVNRAAWATPIPVDPGPHTIAASATGREPWRSTVDIKKARDRATVRIHLSVPAEKSASAPTPAPSSPPPPASFVSKPFPKTPVGIGVASVGVLGIATGLVFGLLAKNQTSTIDATCPGSSCADRAGLDANATAHTFASISTIAVIAGSVLAAAGVAIWLWPVQSEP